MLPDNDRGRPGEEAAPEIVATRHIDNDIVAENVVADEWARSVARGYYWQLSMAADELCSRCLARRRHPGSDLCTAELEAGAGDSFSPEGGS